MGRRKMEEKPPKASSKNPSKKRKPLGLGPNNTDPKKKLTKKKQRHSKTKDDNSNSDARVQQSDNGQNCDKGVAPVPSPSEQLKFFLDQFQSANGLHLSSLELESITGIYIYIYIFFFFHFWVCFYISICIYIYIYTEFG